MISPLKSLTGGEIRESSSKAFFFFILMALFSAEAFYSRAGRNARRLEEGKIKARGELFTGVY